MNVKSYIRLLRRINWSQRNEHGVWPRGTVLEVDRDVAFVFCLRGWAQWVAVLDVAWARMQQKAA